MSLSRRPASRTPACSAEGSQRCRTCSDVFESRRRIAALVNRPHRVPWNCGSMSSASQAGVSASPEGNQNVLCKTRLFGTYHSLIHIDDIVIIMLMWYLDGALCRQQGCLEPVQHSPLPTHSAAVPQQRIHRTFPPSAAGRAAHVQTSQRALQTRWPRPARTDWSALSGGAVITPQKQSS